MLSTTINNLISDLKPRQREVLVGRFGLKDGEKKTLQAIGDQYGISRERVRQIEEEAIKTAQERFKKERTAEEILKFINNHLTNVGGLRRDDLFVPEIKIILRDNNLHHWHLRFLSEVLGQPLYQPANNEFHNFWYLNKKHLGLVSRFILNLEKIIIDKKEELIIYKKFEDYFLKIVKKHNIPDFIAVNYLSLSKKFHINPFGDFGLSEWEEINPKTINEKAYLVLKKHNQPLHFREISDLINRLGFSGRLANPSTVHNELIKDPRFVLVGRGMYGLAEHGFKPGITQEVIYQILKEKGPLSLEEIINLVQKQRFVKNNTIILNLQNKKYFKKLEDGRYNIR